VRFGATAILKLLREVNRAVKMETTIVIDINIQGPEIGRGVDDTNFARLHKVVCDGDVLLVRSNLDVVRPNCVLVFIRIIEPLNIIKIANVKSGDVIRRGQGEVGELAILADVGA
jgi:hypothetical protein